MAQRTGSMRDDWNERAREDAHYYVAFGRRNQDEEEFFATSFEVVYGLEYELKRFGRQANRRAWRALEIGCGPGRLMKPLSKHFGEIHGVDVSDEMVARARGNLRGIPHAHVHLSPGDTLPQFADESFDFVYSYAVFQHIPSREIVYSYLREARRVLKTGGLLWFQVNGLPDAEAPPDTWSGVRFRAGDLREFANTHDFQMYTLEGVHSQYMWTSLRKRPGGWYRTLPEQPPPPRATRIRRISNPHGTEPVVPVRGRFSVASLWIENLHPECGLNHVAVRIEGAPGTANYIAAPLPDGQQQMNVLLPEGVPTGLIPVTLEWLGRPVSTAIMRAVPQGPMVPRLLGVTDATDFLAGTRIRNGSVRVTLEEVSDPATVRFLLDGAQVNPGAVHCADPRPPRYDFVFALPDSVRAGGHVLEVRIGKRCFPAVSLEVA